jgi:hypothetical protein
MPGTRPGMTSEKNTNAHDIFRPPDASLEDAFYRHPSDFDRILLHPHAAAVVARSRLAFSYRNAHVSGIANHRMIPS